MRGNDFGDSFGDPLRIAHVRHVCGSLTACIANAFGHILGFSEF
jgi:hypothetical protein